MPITRTAWSDDDGTGTTGTIINNAEKTILYNQIDALVGPWTNVPFSAANFTGTGGMTWTVGSPAVLENKYCVHNKVLFWSIYMSWFSGNNVLSGTPGNTLRLILPAGLQTALNSKLPVAYNATAGVPVLGGLQATPSANFLDIQKGDSANFALSDVPGFISMFTIGVL